MPPPGVTPSTPHIEPSRLRSSLSNRPWPRKARNEIAYPVVHGSPARFSLRFFFAEGSGLQIEVGLRRSSLLLLDPVPKGPF